MATTTQPPAAFIAYQANGSDVLCGICSRLWAQTGYSDFNALLNDTMSANPQVADWTASLDGLTILVPTTGG